MLLLSAIVLLGSNRLSGVPSATVVGSSDPSQPGGTHFWRPGTSIATGIPGHVAQHITLSGSTCPHTQKYCGQILLSKDFGTSYTVAKNLTSGSATANFNDFGGLGTLLPPPTKNVAAGGGATPLGQLPQCQFETLVGAGGSKLQKQTWLDDESDGALKLVKNASVALLGTPASFLAADSWISSPTQTIIRTSNNSLLLSVYGKVADGEMICNGGGKRCYTTAFYLSGDDGATFRYASRIDATVNMTLPDHHGTHSSPAVEGPSQASMALLPDGRILTIFTLLTGEGAGAVINSTAKIGAAYPGGNQGLNLWKAYSSDGGLTWTTPVPISGCRGVRHDPKGIYPQLIMLENGDITMSTGRPNVQFWTSSAKTGGLCWNYYGMDGCYQPPAPPYGNLFGTSGYTSMTKVAPNVLLMTYDQAPVGVDGTPGVQRVYNKIQNLTK